MSIKNILKISIVILFAFVFTDVALKSDCGNPPVITSPNDYDIYIARKTYTDLFDATGDPVISWSGPGTLDPTTGSPVSWTAPTTTGNVTITATNSSGSDQIPIKTTNIIYVDITATGNDNGTSWADAFDTIGEAIGASVAGNEIWVADGTYTLSYQLYVNKAISIYGGFEGDETSREQRDWETYDTIVDGGNSRRCFYVTDDATIDGFTIQNGFTYGDGAGMAVYNCSPTVANCTFTNNNAGHPEYGDDADGGGMHNWKSSPTVTNCVFNNNSATDDGGGLANKSDSSGTFTNCVFSNNSTLGCNEGKSDGGGAFNTSSETDPVGSNPTFTNCVFANNSTVRDGGGAYNADTDTDPTYTNCIFYSNSAGDNGGGISIKDGSDTTVTNCVFANNSSSGDGGGAHNSKSGTNPSYINCTFYGNSSSDDGGGIAVKKGSGTTVTNCILWDDQASATGNEIYVTEVSTITVSYSDVEGGYSGTENIDSDPDFVDSSDPDGPDNEFITDDDGFRLIGWRTSFSPCIDEGNNSAVSESYDIIGNTRIVDGDGDSTATVDMGAYEFANTDTDGDGMPDWWEVTYGLDPTVSTGSNGADGDGDSDNWRNIVEYMLRTEPDNGSSDGVDRMPTGWTTMEIEAKWIISGSTFTSLQNDFSEGTYYSASGTTYYMDWKWDNQNNEKKFWDFYYDNSSDVLSDGLHALRKRRRLSTPYNDPANRDYQRVQYKSDPYRFGATWLRQEYEDDNLSDAAAANIVEGDSTTWAAIPQPYDTIAAVLSDHPSFDESTLDDFLEVVDYRNKIDFEISNYDHYTMSLDNVTSTYSGEDPEQFYELELEIIPMPHNAAQVEELFRIMADLEANYTLTPSTTSKGGMEVPESF